MRDTRWRYAGEVGVPFGAHFGRTRVNGKPVQFRHGRATVSGEPPSRHSDTSGEGIGTRASIRKSGYRTRECFFTHPPREKVGVLEMPHSSRALLVVCSLVAAPFLFSASALAQSTPSPLTSPSAVPEIGRVSTSDRQDEPTNATARNTYVVTKDAMLRYGYTDVASAVATLPGVVILRYGVSGTGASVSIRGSSASDVLVLLDGRPVAGTQIGGVDLGAIQTTGIERIEVVEGSGSTLYGTGATGGVINIITARGSGALTTPIVSLSDGSFNDRRFAVETPNISFSREVATNAYDYSALGGVPAGTRTNADLQTTTFRAGESATVGAVRLTGSVGMTSRHLGIPGSTSFLTPTARQDDDTSDARVSAALVRERATTTLDLSGTRETLVFRDLDPNDGGPVVDFNTDARVQVSLRNVVATDGNRIVYGIDLAHGVARNDGGNALFSATPFAQTAAYVQDSVELGGGSRVYAGLRAERDGAAGGAIAPALGGIVALGPNLLLRVNGATSFRAPTAEDLTFPGFSNPLLVPERTKTFDTTLSAPHAFGGASFGYFLETGNNLIVLNPNADFSLPFGPANEPLINAQQASIAGFTFDIATPSFNGFVTKLNLTDTYRATSYGNGVPAARLANRPVMSANLDFGYTGRRESALAAFGVVARISGETAITQPTTAYTRVDAYARIRLARRALLSLRAYNLGGEGYAEFGGYPMPGRTYTVELSTR